jgi:hypothetical protein
MTKALDEVKRVFLVCLQQIELFYSPFVPKNEGKNMLENLREDLIRVSQEIFF